MKNIKKDIEQLEIAAELLDKNSPTGARLSLFLLDNLAELLMYNSVRMEFAWDDQFASVRPPKCSANKRRKIMDYFNDKVNFLVEEKKLDYDQEQVLKLGHRLRNEAYHNGILREYIIIPITRAYLQTVCELLPTLWIGSYSYTNHNEVKDFLKKYDENFGDIDHDSLRQICQIILKGRECEVSQLALAVSDDLINRVEETIEGLEYLSSNGQKKSPDEILKWMQFREETDIEFGVVKSDEEFRELWKKVEQALSVFRPKVTLRTLESWKRKAERIKLEASSGVISAKFQEIDQPFLKIENFVSEAVFEYDEYINSQMHG